MQPEAVSRDQERNGVGGEKDNVSSCWSDLLFESIKFPGLEAELVTTTRFFPVVCKGKQEYGG